jgi:hypothetical protein
VLLKKTAFSELTQIEKVNAERITKGERENRKKQKHQNRKIPKRGATINIVITIARFVFF